VSTPSATVVSPKKHHGFVRNVLGLTGMVCLAIFIALVATGGSYAMWNTKTTVNASSVASGSTAITINSVANYAIPDLAAGTLLPGRSVVSAPLAVKNTGSTAVSVTVGATTFADPSSAIASSLTVYVRQAATCEVTPAGTTPQSFATPIVLASGATTQVCVEVRMSDAAPATVQGQSANFSVQLDAVQKR